MNQHEKNIRLNGVAFPFLKQKRSSQKNQEGGMFNVGNGLPASHLNRSSQQSESISIKGSSAK